MLSALGCQQQERALFFVVYNAEVRLWIKEWIKTRTMWTSGKVFVLSPLQTPAAVGWWTTRG